MPEPLVWLAVQLVVRQPAAFWFVGPRLYRPTIVRTQLVSDPDTSQRGDSQHHSCKNYLSHHWSGDQFGCYDTARSNSGSSQRNDPSPCN